MKKFVIASLLALSSTTLGFGAPTNSKDPIIVSVSLNKQHLRVFQGTHEIANSNISSGKSGNNTPTGIFSILQKNRHHRSNIYSNAPMPFMQRLTWSGIALHASNHVPRHPASHGCVRMPHTFAAQLFKMNTMGMHVVIENETQSPRRFQHQALFSPRITWKTSSKYEPWLNEHIEQSNVGFAQSDQRHPARIFITRRTSKEILIDAQRLLNKLGFDAGEVDGIMGPATWSAITRYQRSKGNKDSGITRKLMADLFADAGEERSANGRLLVRKHHKTIFETEIHIEEAEKPLGSHILTVSNFDRQFGKTDWIAISLRDRIQTDVQMEAFQTADTTTDRHSLTSALDRVHMSAHDHEQVRRLLSPASSITISDNGMSIETGKKGTDFIVLTDPEEEQPELASDATGQSG